MGRIWDEFLTERDKKVFRAAGYGKHAGFRNRPALVVIDVTYGFVGDKPEDILTSVQTFRNSCGEEGWRAMENLVPVLEVARRKKVPIFYTIYDHDHPYLDKISWGAKNERVSERVEDQKSANAIPTLIAPQCDDFVISKLKPSIFFDTLLLQYLVSHEINQLICCGTTTSGCVRASVIDAFSYNFRVAVIEDCTFDRGQASHALNLFEMNQKYADVVRSNEVIKYIKGLPGECRQVSKY